MSPEELNNYGLRLSLALGCPVRLSRQRDIKGIEAPAPKFVCKHGMGIAVFRLKGTEDWSDIVEEHGRFG